MSENNTLRSRILGKTTEQEIAARPYGVMNGRWALAGQAKLPTYLDWCETHGESPHLTVSKNHQCITCEVEAEGVTRRVALALKAVTFDGTCPTHGRVPFSTRTGHCSQCRRSNGTKRAEPRARSPRAEARAAGEATFMGICEAHAGTAHSVAHGKCLTCYTTAGVRRVGLRETYRAVSYAPELVTGVYVRRQREGLYKIAEAATGTGRWAGMAGHGPTLREYETDGAILPDDVRERADAERTTILWEYR